MNDDDDVIDVVEDDDQEITYYKNGVTCVKDCDQSTIWYKDGLEHRDDDEPAAHFGNGNEAWYQHGKLHRDHDQPAITATNGHTEWYQNNKLHRDGLLPAMIIPAFVNLPQEERYYKYGIRYTRELLIVYYSRLSKFGRYALKKIRLARLRKLKRFDGELLCMPPKNNYPGGQDYHGLVSYFNKL